MAEILNGVTKVNGATKTSLEALGSRQEFIAVTTSVDIRTATQSGGSAGSQAALDKLVEILSQRGQPVILGAVTGAGPYVLKIVNEHYQGWGAVEGTSGAQLADRLVADGINYSSYGTVTYTIDDHLV